MKISVIIPCHNEAEAVVAVIKKIPAGVHEIIVVDNASTDATAELARDNGARVIHENRLGYGTALQCGLKAATGEWCVTLDGDGQYPAEKITDLVNYAHQNKLDFLSAVRFPLSDKKAMPLVRRLGNKIFNAAVRCLFGLKTKDSQSGMWIIRQRILSRIVPKRNGMAFSQEIKLRAVHEGLSYGEKNIPYYPRGGASKLVPWKHGLLNLWQLLVLRSSWLRDDIKKISFWYAVICFLAMVLFTVVSWPHLSDLFVHGNDDVSGLNGMSAWNWLRFGPLAMKFGLFENWIHDPAQIAGAFYVHHPNFFLIPIYLSYKILGVSEFSTRIGPMVWTLLGCTAFAAGLKKVYGQKIIAPLATFGVFLALPGLLYYGHMPELAVFSLPAALMTWNFFVQYAETKKVTFAWFFYFSIFIGAIMGWFYYFLPISLWLFLWTKIGKTLPNRRALCITIPLILCLATLLTLSHFYWLIGTSPLNGLFGAFEYRASRPSFLPWFGKIAFVGVMNFTTVAFWVGLLGCVVLVYKSTKEKKLAYFWPLILMPILNIAVFFQWTMHLFGLTFWLPVVAIGCGFLCAEAINYTKGLGWVMVTVFAAVFVWQIHTQLIGFYQKVVILTKNDIAMLAALRPYIQSGSVCIGENDVGLGYNGIVDWNLRTETLRSPHCLTDPALRGALVFAVDKPYYREQMDKFFARGLKPLLCADDWCFMGDAEYGRVLGIQAASTTVPSSVGRR